MIKILNKLEHKQSLPIVVNQLLSVMNDKARIVVLYFSSGSNVYDLDEKSFANNHYILGSNSAVNQVHEIKSPYRF